MQKFPSYIIGNWKMNQSLDEVNFFFNKLHDLMKNVSWNSENWIAPQTLLVDRCIQLSNKLLPKLKIGTQNIGHLESGAFTGENSAREAKSLGAHFTLVAHSERRHFFHEPDELFAQKIIKALQLGLDVVYCIGETLSEFENKKTMQVLEKQLACLKSVALALPSSERGSSLILAYEPVWAIGTGLTANAEQISSSHTYIDETVRNIWGGPLPILYGGSVKPENAVGILSLPFVHGLLVGGASLSAESFFQLTQAASKRNEAKN